MGREAGVTKDRPCPNCGKAIRGTATILQEHATVCKKMTEIGMVGVGDVELVRLE